MTEPYKHPDTPTPGGEVLQDHFEAQQWESSRKPKSIFKASDTFKCQTQIFYQRRPDEYPVDEDLPLGLFEQGENTERSFVRALGREYGGGNVVGEKTPDDEQPWCRVEIESEGDNGEDRVIQVRGMPDALVLSYNLDPFLLYEVKSKSKLWDGLDATNYHVGQAAVYKKALAPEHARLIYLSRNNLHDDADPPEFDLDTDYDWPDLWRRVEEYYRELDEYDRRDEVPPPSPTASFQCKFCPYADEHCRVDWPEEWADGSPPEPVTDKEWQA